MTQRDFLSARGRAALSRRQREVTNHLRELHSVDRVLSGALCACDATTQRESVENYLETVQELRVSLQRLEGFLLQRLIRGPHDDPTDASSAGVNGDVEELRAAE